MRGTDVIAVHSRRSAVFVLPAVLFLLAVFVVPLGGIIYQSLTVNGSRQLSLSAYRGIADTWLFYKVAWNTFEISTLAALFSLMLAYPIAAYLAMQNSRRRAILTVLVLIPFWTSVLVKSFAFTVILGHSGIVNSMLVALHIPPVPLLFNRIGVVIGLSHYLIPFMVFPILTSLLAQPPELARAAELMGAGRGYIWRRVTFPLSLPGVMTGTLLAVILSLGSFVLPVLLGSRQDMMLANMVDFYTRETLNWQKASAVAVVLLSLAILVTLGLARVRGGATLLGDSDS